MKVKEKEIHAQISFIRNIKAERIYGPFEIKTMEIRRGARFMDFDSTIFSLN